MRTLYIMLFPYLLLLQIKQRFLRNRNSLVCLIAIAFSTVSLSETSAFESFAGRWDVDRVNAWYSRQPWPVGANFVPSTAINQLEMWQAETFDPETINRELGWAADVGMNTMRVYLHDIPWREDSEGFSQRIEEYLSIADRHGIRTMFVFFDGVWNPLPKPGKQPAPQPRVHNSGWVQSPGKEILSDPKRQDALEAYVKGVLERFGNDERVLVWDLFNEPDNANVGKWGGSPMQDMDKQLKHDRACELLEKAFRWAREVGPSQPLTAGVWGNPKWLKNPSRIDQISLTNSDVISFHTYHNASQAAPIIQSMVNAFDRPLFCTEYMARGNGSTFEGLLPKFKAHKIAAYNWGLVSGKSQTIYPWDSWKKTYTEEPDPWFHDVFRKDGSAYRESETNLISELTTQWDGSSSKHPTVAQPLAPEEIAEGLEQHSLALFIKAGWIRDPYIVLGPDDFYYLTGTTPLPDDPRQHSDPYNTGLGEKSIVGWKMQVWKSPDLIQWQSLGTPFTLKDGIWLEKEPARFASVPLKQWRLWAPELHFVDGKWVVVHTSPSPVKGANLALSSGSQIRGPWQHPMGPAIARRHGPSLFQDDDGQLWLIWGATMIAPLKADLSDLAGKPMKIGPTGATSKMGHEGCLIRKIGGKYVLFGTGWSTGQMRRGSYILYYAVADKITGPYGERQFVGRFLGHGTPFQDRDGKWWCTAFFNANSPPIVDEGIQQSDLSDNAYSINAQGVTLVPLQVSVDEDGEILIRAKDDRYSSPGPDEAQSFNIEGAIHGSKNVPETL